MNPVALSIFIKYFLTGTWLVHLYENCYETDADESEHDMTPTTNAGFFPSFAGNSNSSVVHPEEEFWDKNSSGDFKTRQVVDDFSLPSNVKSELYKLPWYSNKTALSWGSLTLEDLTGSNYTATVFTAGIALQCFTGSSLFQQLVQREWVVDESVISMPSFSLIERKASTKYDPMNLNLIYLFNAMFLHISTRLPLTIRPGSSFKRTADLPREDIMQFFAQDTWVYQMESLIQRLPFALTICTADLTTIPCIWKHEFVNTEFTDSFPSAVTTNTINAPLQPKDDNGAEYDNMQMVSLMQRAIKNQATLQLDILNKIGSGVGTVKFGLRNLRSSRRSTSPSVPSVGMSSGEAKQNKDARQEEFVHMVCLAPIFQMAADEDKNSQDVIHALLPIVHSIKPRPSDDVGCFGRWFSMFSSSSASNGVKNNPSDHRHNSQHHQSHSKPTQGGLSWWKDDETNAAHNSGPGGDTEAKMVAVHMDMSRASAQAGDLVKMCLLSFLIARLLE
jgi:hypothetical protein